MKNKPAVPTPIHSFTSADSFRTWLLNNHAQSREWTKEKLRVEEDLKNHGAELDEWVELSEKTFNFARYTRTGLLKATSKLNVLSLHSSDRTRY